VCQAWAADSREPMVTLVARHGVIVTHQAFGLGGGQSPIGRDYRADVASITKSITGILFGQFLDQGLLGLDDSLARVLPDYDREQRHAPTFRQCFTHTSGLEGHGAFGGVSNPWLDNVILNGLDENQPGKTYRYSGMGYELVGSAMQVLTGKSWRRLYEEQLFRPLGFGQVPMQHAADGAQFTAFELGVLAQWMANRGSYGDLEFIRPETFEQLLPQPLDRYYPGMKAIEGIGNHPMNLIGLAAKSARLFGPHTIGHGSLTGSIFVIDIDSGLVIVQVRRQVAPRYAEWSAKFYQAIAESLTGG
jgi:CubicO group peptidase (beta-lactamase class C family)